MAGGGRWGGGVCYIRGSGSTGGPIGLRLRVTGKMFQSIVIINVKTKRMSKKHLTIQHWIRFFSWQSSDSKSNLCLVIDCFPNHPTVNAGARNQYNFVITHLKLCVFSSLEMVFK